MQSSHGEKKLNDKQLMEIRYEDMVSDPPKKLTEICKFLGVDYEPEMLSYYSSPEAGKWSASEACHAYVAQPITTDYVEAWKKTPGTRRHLHALRLDR